MRFFRLYMGSKYGWEFHSPCFQIFLEIPKQMEQMWKTGRIEIGYNLSVSTLGLGPFLPCTHRPLSYVLPRFQFFLKIWK